MLGTQHACNQKPQAGTFKGIKFGYLRVKLEKMTAGGPSGALTSCHTTELIIYYSSLILLYHQATASLVFPFPLLI